MAGRGDGAFRFARAEEGAFRRDVAAEDDAPIPGAKIAGDAKVGRAWGQAGGVGAGEGSGKAPETSVHGHEQVVFADVADARPLGMPAVRAVVGVGGLGQPPGAPSAVIETLEQQRTLVPTHGPEGIGVGMLVAVDAARAGDFGKLRAPDELEISGAGPFAERAAFRIGIAFGERAVFAIVGKHEAALAGVEPFAVPAGETRGHRGRMRFGGAAGLRDIHAILEEARDFERLDIDLVEAGLHGGEVDLVRRVGEMSGGAGEASGHLLPRDDADVSRGIDDVGAEEELVGFAMDEAIRRGAADAFRADDLTEVGRDFVELVARAKGHVGSVANDPEAVGPRDHGAGAAFAFMVESCEGGVDAGERGRFGDGGGARGENRKGEETLHGESAHSAADKGKPEGLYLDEISYIVDSKKASPDQECAADWRQLNCEWLWVYEAPPPTDERWSGDLEVPAGVFFVLQGLARIEAAGRRVEIPAGAGILAAPGIRRQWFAQDTRLLSVGYRANWPNGLPVVAVGLNRLVSGPEMGRLVAATRRLFRAIHGGGGTGGF